MDNQFYSTSYNYISVLVFKLIHVCKVGTWSVVWRSWVIFLFTYQYLLINNSFFYFHIWIALKWSWDYYRLNQVFCNSLFNGHNLVVKMVFFIGMFEKKNRLKFAKMGYCVNLLKRRHTIHVSVIWFFWSINSSGNHITDLTHCGLVTPHSNINRGSTLAVVMACCLMAPSHYLNQFWLINNEVMHSPEGNWRGNAQNAYPWFEFKNY